MKAMFEEKDFEAPLYSELKFGSHRIATPGQVFEGKFGIDAALQAENPLFWDLFGFYDVPRGVILDDLRWGFIWNRLGKKRRLPTFSTNLLIQAKRPKPIERIPNELKAHGFNKQYWRYKITKHQHELLESVSSNLRRRALVIYASPAFHDLDSLYDFTEAQTIVENTNFVKVEKLTNHKRWNYFEAGTSGVAHSEPEFIEDIPFHSMVEVARESSQQEGNASENLRILSETAIEICQQNQETNPVARYYLRLHGRLRRMEELYESSEIINYVSFKIFCDVVKLKWLVL